MSFERKRFLGLTVIDFNASVGWNDTESSVTITIAAEDGESIQPYKIGENYEFSMEMESFYFNGFLDRIIEKHSTSGNIYEIKLNDGKELIRNVECITGLYGTSDPKEDAPIINLFNVFRYFESKSFGASQANDTGIPYYKFEQAVNYLSKQYGIVSAGKRYSINLNFASALPKYYRVEVPIVNLMDVISKICDDLGLLFRVELLADQFVVKTVSLAYDSANQKVENIIKTLAKDRNVLSWDAGVESSNNINSNFMLWGGPKEHTFAFDGSKERIKQFLGYDREGTPYWVSTTYTTYPTSCPNNDLGGLNFIDFNVKSHPAAQGYFCLPVKGIEDIILSNNGLYIQIDVAGCAIILGGNQDLWELYLEIRQDQRMDYLYEQIYLKPPRPNIKNVANFIAFGGSEESPIKREFGERENDVGVIRGTRVFGYLKQLLDSLIGKQFVVAVNDSKGLLSSDFSNINASSPTSKVDGLLSGKQKLESYIDEDSLALNSNDGTPKKIYNIVPTDSGWTEPSLLYSLVGSNTNKTYVDGYILDANGKTKNFLVFIKYAQGTFIFENSEDSFTSEDGKYLWIPCSINSEYVIINNQEHILVTINNSVNLNDPQQINEVGYFYLTNCFFGVKDKNSVLGQSLSVKTGMLPLQPIALLANFKSTRNDFYGPWYFGGSGGGKTVVEKDDSLVPWNFNSSSTLQTAASEKLKEIIPIPYMETGTISKVGLPDKNLGDEIVKNGPILTSLSCTYGASGITTQYSFRTFTPKFGLPSRYINERLKKTAIKSYSDRKNILALYNESLKKTQAISRRNAGFAIQSFFLDYLGRRNDRNTPHSNFVMAQISAYGKLGVPLRTKTLAATMSNRETNASIHTQSGNNLNKGALSLDGIFSPFKNFGAGNLTSQTIDPNSTFSEIDINIPNAYTYNPFRKGSYISSFISDNGYEWNNLHQNVGYNIKNEGSQLKPQINMSRPIAIRGPIMVSGWGTDLFTKQTVPNQNAYNTAEALAGPVDLMWDSLRGVWTSHDIFYGINSGLAIPPIPQDNFPFIASVYPKTTLNGTNKYNSNAIQVLNVGKYIAPGSPIVAKYSVYDGNWYTEGQGCETRYSEAECFSEVVPSGNSDFKVTRHINGDIASCINFRCYNLVETNGFTGDHIALTSPNGASITATFKNGLLKKTVNNPPPTTPAPPTTVPPLVYKWYSQQNEIGCYECFSYIEPPAIYGAEYDDQESCNLGIEFDNSSNPLCSESYCLDTYTGDTPPFGPDCRACVPYYQGCGGTAYVGENSLERCRASETTHNEVNCTTTTTTSTTASPYCVDVISSVTCNADGSISTQTKSVLGCAYLDSNSIGTTTPPVYLYDFNTQLMKIEIESLKQQLSNLYNVLEAHGIKINE